MKIKSDYAVLEIKGQRAAATIERRTDNAPHLGPCPVEMTVPVIIMGRIGRPFNDFDGTSQGFVVEVDSVEVVNLANGEKGD